VTPFKLVAEHCIGDTAKSYGLGTYEQYANY